MSTSTPCAELDADIEMMSGLKALVSELEQKSALADGRVSYDDVLENVIGEV